MTKISEVIARLEQIIEWARANESPLGYFAAVYLKMTFAVRDAIERGDFENGSRMEQMDVVFARRYLDAFDAWQAGKMPTQAWRTAFEAAQDTSLTVMQHILLGINAHINLDLGIAAAAVRQRDAIYGMRHDFEHVNDIIASLVDDTQDRLAAIWLPFRWLDQLLRTEDEGWINFSICAARSAAWQAALQLAFAPDKSAEQRIIQDLDRFVSSFAERVRRPPFFLLRWVMRLMRRWESGSVREKIGVLEKP